MKKWMSNSLIVIFALVFLVSAFFLGKYFWESRQQKGQYDQLAQLVEQAKAEKPQKNPTNTDPIDPADPDAPPQETTEAESELDQLRQSLLERQRKEAMESIRTAITWLEPRNEIGRCLFTKEPEPLKREQGYRYQHHVKDLLRALDTITERSERKLPPPTVNFAGIVGKEPYPIGRKTGEVLRQLLLRGMEKLKNLFKGNRSRSEIVATFLAVLDLCKTNSVTLEDDINGDNPTVKLLEKEETPNGNESIAARH